MTERLQSRGDFPPETELEKAEKAAARGDKWALRDLENVYQMGSDEDKIRALVSFVNNKEKLEAAIGNTTYLQPNFDDLVRFAEAYAPQIAEKQKTAAVQRAVASSEVASSAVAKGQGERELGFPAFRAALEKHYPKGIPQPVLEQFEQYANKLDAEVAMDKGGKTPVVAHDDMRIFFKGLGIPLKDLPMLQTNGGKSIKAEATVPAGEANAPVTAQASADNVEGTRKTVRAIDTQRKRLAKSFTDQHPNASDAAIDTYLDLSARQHQQFKAGDKAGAEATRLELKAFMEGQGTAAAKGNPLESKEDPDFELLKSLHGGTVPVEKVDQLEAARAEGDAATQAFMNNEIDLATERKGTTGSYRTPLPISSAGESSLRNGNEDLTRSEERLEEVDDTTPKVHFDRGNRKEPSLKPTEKLTAVQEYQVMGEKFAEGLDKKSMLEEVIGKLVNLGKEGKEGASAAYEAARGFLDKRGGTLGKRLNKLMGGERAEKKEGDAEFKDLAKHLAGRNKALDKESKLKKYGKAAGEQFLKASEAYRKLPLKYKILISGSLLTASAFASGGTSTIFTSVMSAAMLGQRALGAGGAYIGLEGWMEKRLVAQEKESGEVRTRFETWKKHGIATAAALTLFSGIPGQAIRDVSDATGLSNLIGKALGYIPGIPGMSRPDGASVARPPADAAVGINEPAPGYIPPPGGNMTEDAVRQAQQAAAAQDNVAPAPASVAPANAPVAPAVAEQAPGAKPANAPATTKTPVFEAPESFAEVSATAGDGYESMAKKMLKELHALGVDNPENYPEGSDIRKLLEAKPRGLSAVVHELATKNEFFKADGTSVQVDLGDKMIINADGSLAVEKVGGESVVQAPADAPRTAPVRPAAAPTRIDAPVAADGSMRPAPLNVRADIERAAAEMKARVAEAALPPTPEAEANAPAEPSPSTSIKPEAAAPAAPVETTPAPSQPQVVPESSNVPGEHSIINSYNVEVRTNEPHIYRGADDRPSIFGGSRAAQEKSIIAFLKENPGKEIVGSDDAGTARFLFRAGAGGEIQSDIMISKGVFGFFGGPMKPLGPNDLRSLIK